MTWIEPAVAAVSLANDLAKSSSFIRRHAKRIIFRIKNGNVVLPIFGSGGTGKSTVARLLVGEDPLDIAAPYEESWWIEPVDLIGDVPGQILVGPGQLTRAERHWPKLFQKVTSGTAIGLINVVAYGLHSFAIRSFKEHDLYEEGMIVEHFARVFQEARRTDELTMLQKVIDGLTVRQKPVWMVTLVNKQDLWWEHRDRVRKYYEEGPYAEKIEMLRRRIGGGAFQHEFLPVSLTIGNLNSPAGEVIASTTAGYDLPTHLRYLQSMFARINGLMELGSPD